MPHLWQQESGDRSRSLWLWMAVLVSVGARVRACVGTLTNGSECDRGEEREGLGSVNV